MPATSYLTKLINCEAITTQPLHLQSTIDKGVAIDVLRLDLIHPIISGNKYFKLKIAVRRAIDSGANGIISFGGAYSNHLVALSFLCQALNIPCIGIVRGEQPKLLSPSLMDATSFGMKAIYVSRESYSDKQVLVEKLATQHPGYFVIPEGGQSPDGVDGSAEILRFATHNNYDVIAGAVGTGTMLAGLLKAAKPGQQVLGISALRLQTGNDIEKFIFSQCPGANYTINYNYHFGGYAKKSPALIQYMNYLWHQHRLPTDFVYTAKLIFALDDLVKINYFLPGTRILAIHSGGLQGNRSIAGQLDYQST